MAIIKESKTKNKKPAAQIIKKTNSKKKKYVPKGRVKRVVFDKNSCVGADIIITKRPIGRTTKYDPRYAEEMIEFFAQPPEYEREIVQQNFKGEPIVTKKIYPNKLPTFVDFAMKIGVHVDTMVSEWKNKYPEFSEAYKMCKQLQENFMISNGLHGLYPSASFIFVAKNITSLRDKIDTEVTHNIGTNLSNYTKEKLHILTDAELQRVLNRQDLNQSESGTRPKLQEGYTSEVQE